MLRPTPKSTPTDTLLPYTTLFLSLPRPHELGPAGAVRGPAGHCCIHRGAGAPRVAGAVHAGRAARRRVTDHVGGAAHHRRGAPARARRRCACPAVARRTPRSAEHTSELQSLMRNSYAVFCLTKKT